MLSNGFLENVIRRITMRYRQKPKRNKRARRYDEYRFFKYETKPIKIRYELAECAFFHGYPMKKFKLHSKTDLTGQDQLEIMQNIRNEYGRLPQIVIDAHEKDVIIINHVTVKKMEETADRYEQYINAYVRSQILKQHPEDNELPEEISDLGENPFNYQTMGKNRE